MPEPEELVDEPIVDDIPDNTDETAPETTEVSEPSDDLILQMYGDELAKSFSPEQREAILAAEVRRLSALPVSKDTAEPTGTAERPVERTPLVPLPELTAESLAQKIGNALEDAIPGADGPRVAEILSGILKPLADGVQSVTQNALMKVDEMNRAMLPAQIRSTVPKVRGATEADAQAATQYYLDRKGGVTEEEALRIVVQRRLEQALSVKPSSDEAKRKADALRATRHAAPSRTPGGAKLPTAGTFGELGERMREMVQ